MCKSLSLERNMMRKPPTISGTSMRIPNPKNAQPKQQIGAKNKKVILRALFISGIESETTFLLDQ